MAACTDDGFKQKAVIEFLTIEGVGAKEICHRLRNVYKESALSYASVRRWVVQFKSSNSDISDKPCSGKCWKSDDDGFLDIQGVLLLDFLPKGETINSARYQETTRRRAQADAAAASAPAGR